MKKVSLYSRSGSRKKNNAQEPARQSKPGTGIGDSPAVHVPPQAIAGNVSQSKPAASPVPPGPSAAHPPGKGSVRARTRAFLSRHERLFLVLSSVLLSMLLFSAYNASKAPARQFTQRDIDAAVKHTLEKNLMPAQEVKAYQNVRRSIVRVAQRGKANGNDPGKLHGVGTGVVVVDKGVILTNLHVVQGAERVQVTFADGTESDATVIGQQPENDLAVLQAMKLPDDLTPATLRSTGGLQMGDKVIAVGFPFGIGPSVSSGIISGLRREYHSPEGQRVLTNLIQFDAAANPGNSGGPLVTMDGEVVGIVTAILNPTEHSTFIGIGFAVPIENAAAAVGESPF